MKHFQQSLDTRSLHLFITVMESNSLTEAADKLAVNQSTISHALERLRQIFNDPLLVRSGRSVTPTNRAIELLPQAKQLLSAFERLTENPTFEPQTADIHYTIAANDFQCEYLLPKLYRQIAPQVKSLQLTVVPSWLPSSNEIRNGGADLIISPKRPDGGDIMQRKLYDFHKRCYYDPSQRDAPIEAADFINANYICPNFLLDYEAIDLASSATDSVWLRDKTHVVTNSFNSAAHFLRGTTSLAIAPDLLANSAFSDFASVPFPYTEPRTMYLTWSKKFQKDPKHTWFRQQLADLLANKS